MAALVVVLALLIAAGSWSYVDELLRRDAAVAALLAEARPLLASARAGRQGDARAREGIAEHLRAGATEPAERAWTRALARVPALEDALLRAELGLQRALRLDAERGDVRETFLAVLHERTRLADAQGHVVERDRLIERMRGHGADAKLVRWTRPSPLTLNTSPTGLSARLYQYTREEGGRLRAEPAEVAAGPTPRRWSLAPGSYLVELDGDERSVGVRLPLVVPAGARTPRAAHVEVPARAEAPAGLVYVPSGWSEFGYGGDAIRAPVRRWYRTVPPHRRYVSGFYIARHETTYGRAGGAAAGGHL